MYINRDIENLLKQSSKQFSAIALTGPRQTGKSTLLKRLFGKTHAYVTLDDPIMRQRAESDPKLFFESLGEKVIIDEIQYVPQLTSYIKIAIDEKRTSKGRFILTGSQQFHLIKNLGDSLAGRVAIFELLPFSSSEKKRIPSLRKKVMKSKDMFMLSCLRGCYPEPSVQQNIDINQWTAGYFQTYLERDIKSIFGIGDLRDFQRFMQLLAARCSQVLNFSTFAADIGVAVNTIKRWISVLEASRIIYLLYPYHTNLGKRIVKAPKVYFLDCGLVCYLTGIHNKEILMNGPLAGPLFENYCIQETVKQIINTKKSVGLYYIRTNNNLEVDLLVEKEMALNPVEIKLNMTPRLSDASNLVRLKTVFAKLPIRPAKILSLSDTSFPLIKDVSVVSFDEYIKWLNQ
jgi:predicted AAA+ superfamily ATPase